SPGHQRDRPHRRTVHRPPLHRQPDSTAHRLLPQPHVPPAGRRRPPDSHARRCGLPPVCGVTARGTPFLHPLRAAPCLVGGPCPASSGCAALSSITPTAVS